MGIIRPQSALFLKPPGKKDPHIRVPAAFRVPDGQKQVVKIDRDSRAIGTPNLTSKSGEFRQTDRLSGVFSTRTETERFTGVSWRGADPKRAIRAQSGPGFGHA